jgi:negative regulator of flagellin synthesis FlgM
MRINDKQFVTAEQSDRASDSKKTARSTVAATPVSSTQQQTATDSVELSSRVRDLAEIKSQLQESSDVRESLVNDIRERIKNGTYEVDSREIASRIVGRAEDGIF